MCTWSNAFSQHLSIPKRVLKACWSPPSMRFATATLFPTFHPLTSPALCVLLLFSFSRREIILYKLAVAFFLIYTWPALQSSRSFFRAATSRWVVGYNPVRPPSWLYIYIYTSRVSWYFLIKYSLKLKMKLNRRQCFFAGSTGTVSRFHSRRIESFPFGLFLGPTMVNKVTQSLRSFDQPPLAFCGPPAIHISRRNN